jgi:hypothetical protein
MERHWQNKVEYRFLGNDASLKPCTSAAPKRRTLFTDHFAEGMSKLWTSSDPAVWAEQLGAYDQIIAGLNKDRLVELDR